jgi:hypothetical protein
MKIYFGLLCKFYKMYYISVMDIDMAINLN